MCMVKFDSCDHGFKTDVGVSNHRWRYLFGEQFSDQNAANTVANVASALGI